MAALAVAWTLQHDNVATAIIGASKPEQVQDNVAAVGVRLDADLLTKIDEILDPVDRARSGQDGRELAEDPRGLTEYSRNQGGSGALLR